MTNKKGDIKRIEAKVLREESTDQFDAKRELLLAQAELADMEAQAEFYRVPFMTIDMETKIRELNVYMEAVQLIKDKVGDLPDYGDWNEEEKKWVMKRLFNSKIGTSSLVGGEMNIENVLGKLDMKQVGPKIKSILEKSRKGLTNG